MVAVVGWPLFLSRQSPPPPFLWSWVPTLQSSQCLGWGKKASGSGFAISVNKRAFHPFFKAQPKYCLLWEALPVALCPWNIPYPIQAWCGVGLGVCGTLSSQPQCQPSRAGTRSSGSLSLSYYLAPFRGDSRSPIKPRYLILFQLSSCKSLW